VEVTVVKFSRRQAVRLAAGASALSVLCAFLVVPADDGARSQTRTIKLVVPYPPGSGPDILSRLMSEQIGRGNGPNLVVENRPGRRATLMGTEAVARSVPDGNTILLVANTFVIDPSLRPVNYDVSDSFEPVCHLASTPIVLVVQGSSSYRRLSDLVAAARAKPGEFSVAGSPASSLQIAFEVFKRAANVDMAYLPFVGIPPAITSLLRGEVTAAVADYPAVIAHLKSGALRGLVTASAKRAEPLPEVPTFAEAGLARYDADIFYGVVAPAQTPPDQLAQLTGLFSAALKAADVRPKLDLQGLIPVGLCGADFGTYMRDLAAEYGRIIREADIREPNQFQLDIR
jgi:tripartite-type tricarboxylate transporter receptor subunit TctC